MSRRGNFGPVTGMALAMALSVVFWLAIYLLLF